GSKDGHAGLLLEDHAQEVGAVGVRWLLAGAECAACQPRRACERWLVGDRAEHGRPDTSRDLERREGVDSAQERREVAPAFDIGVEVYAPEAIQDLVADEVRELCGASRARALVRRDVEI